MDRKRTEEGDKDAVFGEVLQLLRSLPSAKFEVLARIMHFDSAAAARDFFCINPHLFPRHVSLISHEANDEELRKCKRLRLAQQDAMFEHQSASPL
jgi:hypothetical protein